MSKQKESLSTSTAKLIMVVSLIVGIGAIIGMLGYFWTMPKSEVIREGGVKKVEVNKNEIIEKEIINDETADWKTYRNEEYGFEVKYPEDWIIENKDERFSFKNISSESSLGIAGFYIKIESEDYLQTMGRYIYVAKTIEEKNIIIGGTGARDIITKKWLGSYRTIYIPKDNATFILETENYPVDIPYEETAARIKKDKEILENLKQFDQILSTFKFIEKDRNL
jgi:hypothetical protein